ncbi:MAG: 3',5'-cyclic-AMP phosphodiesterase [Gammaproteobacteria bacterium]|nr:3',5'-cyclic-AMP phosphodiesterase [Gammaproteobacteria bacterium]
MPSNDKPASIRLIQITDCHLGEEPDSELLGLNTDESLDDVLHLLTATEQRIDMVVASGDIASGAHAAAYQRFPSTVRASIAAPLAWLPGNHDQRDMMRSAAGDHVLMDYCELPHWQIILLDSSVPGYEHGDLEEGEFLRLRQYLEACSKPALVFVHHQPLPVGSHWIDQYVIRKGQQLLDTLAGYSQVKALVWGHVHQEFNGHFSHYQLLATPSTCIQFKPGSYDFALDDSMPGYRWFELGSDGEFTTGVERVAEKHYGIDFQSLGY